MRLLLISLSVLYVCPYALALYSSGDAVAELHEANFDKLVTNSDGVAIVEFYAPWCGHCQSLAPQYKKVASNLKGLALVGAVDCNDKSNAALCGRFGIRGFPTLKLFGPDKTKNPYTGAVGKEPQDYNGPRTAKPIADAVTGLLTDAHIARLADTQQLQEWQDKARAAGKPQVLLFTNKEGSTTLYKALSTTLRASLAFAEVQQGASSVVSRFGVTDFPTLMVVKPEDGSQPEAYGGELKAPALHAFLSGLAGGGKEGDGGKESKDGSGKAGGKADDKAAAAAFVRRVQGLGAAGLAELEAREDMALLAVYGAEGPDGCAAAVSSFLGAAGDMQGLVDTLLVGVAEEELTGSDASRLGAMGVDLKALGAAPCEVQLVLLPFGKDKDDLDDYRKYDGPLEGKALQAWVADAVPSFTMQLDDASGGAFLAVDPSQGAFPIAPKVLLFTNKDEAPGVYRALAMRMRERGNLAFAWVPVSNPASKGIAQSFKPSKVPSLTIVIPQQIEDEQGQARLQFGAQPYFGALKFAPMLEFLESFAKQVETAAGVVRDPELIRKVLPQVTSSSELEAHCTGRPGLCLLALLDSTAPGYEAERKELLSLALRQADGGAFHFAWIEARKHRSVMRAFNVLSSDVPTLVALSAKRMRYAPMPAPSDDDGTDAPPRGRAAAGGAKLRAEAVSAFISGVLEGKVRTEVLQSLPEVRDGDDSGADEDAAPASSSSSGSVAGSGSDGSETAAPGDGGPLEDEFDLSDILSEEVEGEGLVGGKADRLREVEEQLKAEEEARKAAQSSSEKKKKKKSKKKSKKGKDSSSKEEL